ncbi:MAG: hypothetical protein ACOC3V_02700 [bacterium]
MITIKDNQNNPKEGDIYYNKECDIFKVYHSNQWYTYQSNITLDDDYYLMEERKQKIKKSNNV